MKDLKTVYKQKGSKVLLKCIVEDEELTAKDLLEQINQLSYQLGQADSQKKQLEESGERITKNISFMNDELEKMKKFEAWALTVQEQLVVELTKEVYAECVAKVEAYYKDKQIPFDKSVNQMYALLQNNIATHKTVAERIAKGLISEKIMGDESIVNNHWA